MGNNNSFSDETVNALVEEISPFVQINNEEAVMKNLRQYVNEYNIKKLPIKKILDRLLSKSNSSFLSEHIVNYINEVLLRVEKEPLIFYRFTHPFPVLEEYFIRKRLPASEIFYDENFILGNVKFYVLTMKADINAIIPRYGTTLLNRAVRKYNNGYDYLDIIAFLLEHGANPLADRDGDLNIFKILKNIINIGNDPHRIQSALRFQGQKDQLISLLLQTAWKYSNVEELQQLRKEVDELKKQMQAVYYAPGMPGQVEAKENFEQASKNLENV